MEAKENKKERVPTNFVAPANVWRLITSLPNAKTQWLAMKVMLAYGYTGVRYDTKDPMAEGVLDVAIPQIDAMNRRDRRGAPRGNQNARKYYKTASDRNKGEEKTNNANCFASNSMNDSELQGVEKTNNETNTPNCFFDAEKTIKNNNKTISKTNNVNCFASNSMNDNELQGVKKTNKTNIDIDIDIDRLNTSPLTELVLSQEKINKKEKSETAPATLEGGAAPSFSDTRNDFSRDYNARVSAMIGREGGATPQPSQPTSPSLQSPPPPTPAPVCGGKYEIREGDDETMRNIKTQCKAEVARAEEERGAEAKGGPLPKSAGRIRSNDILYDDSKAAEIERERAILEQYEAKAKDMEEDEETRRLFKDLADKLKTKITNYESTKNETKVGDRPGSRGETV